MTRARLYSAMGLSARTRAWTILMLLIALVWPLVLRASVRRSTAVDVLLIECILLMGLVFSAGMDLAEAARIFHARRLPTPMLTQWVRDRVALLALAWAVVSALCALALLRADYGLSWTLPIGWLALGALCVSATLLTPGGLARPVWRAAIVVLVAGAAFAGGTQAAVLALDRAGWPVHFALAAGLLASLALAQRRLALASPVAPAPGIAAGWMARLPAALLAQAHRWTSLNEALLGPRSSRWSNGLLAMINLPFLVWVIAPFDRAHWLSPSSACRVLLLAAMMTPLLSARDVHWRRLLAPGARLRREFGRHVFESTAMLVVPVVVLLVPPLVWAVLQLSGNPVSVCREFALLYPLAFETVLAVMLAVVLLGATPVRWRGFCQRNVYLGGLLLFLALRILGVLDYPHRQPLELPVQDALLYMVVLVLSTAGLVVPANRLWAGFDFASLTGREESAGR